MLYKEVALRMAIRHPRVGEILSNPMTEELKIELAGDYYLIYKEPFSFSGDEVYEPTHHASVGELRRLYPKIEEHNYRFTVAFDNFFLTNCDYSKAPKKLLHTGETKGGIRLENIDFDWYDFIVVDKRCSVNALAELVDEEEAKGFETIKTSDIAKKIRKNNAMLEDWIHNKRWEELLPI